MRKTIIAAVLISGLAVATVASANWGRGGGPGGGYGCQQAMYNQQLDPATQEKIDKFFTDTQGLRKDMAVKQAEKMALLQGSNPDPAAVAKLTGELFDLHTAMQDKAVAAGVDQYLGPMGGGRGCGGGMGAGGCGGGPGRGMMRGGSNF